MARYRGWPRRVTTQKLISRDLTNAKLAKERDGIDATIMYLEPNPEICRAALAAGCMELDDDGELISNCLVTAGMMVFDQNLAARLRRNALALNELAYRVQIEKELTAQQRRADKAELLAAHRNDGTADRGDAIWLAPRFPRMQFYDYTKILGRVLAYARGAYASNYHLTFSYGKNVSDALVRRVVALGVNVAVVFKGDIPSEWLGIRVIDGTKNDWRWRDPVGVIVGLCAKGAATKDTEGFVVEAA